MIHRDEKSSRIPTICEKKRSMMQIGQGLQKHLGGRKKVSPTRIANFDQQIKGIEEKSKWGWSPLYLLLKCYPLQIGL